MSFTTTVSADGTKWMSIWPATIGALRADLTDLLATPRGMVNQSTLAGATATPVATASSTTDTPAVATLRQALSS
jgi:hypothetical protein